MNLEKEKITKLLKNLKNAPDKEIFEMELKNIFLKAAKDLNFPNHIITKILKVQDSTDLQKNIIWKFLYKYRLNTLLESNIYKYKELTNKIPRIALRPLLGFEYAVLPGSEFFLDSSAYIFHRNKPYLISFSVNIFTDKDDFMSEQKWIEKEEVILISALNLALEGGYLSFFLGTDSFSFPFKMENFNHTNISKLKTKIDLYEYVYARTKHEDNVNFSFYNFHYRNDIDKKLFNKISKKIDKNNPVLLRCLYYYSKACALIPTRMLMEEATALQFFCLDGLVKLFMKKYKIKKVLDLPNFLRKEFKFQNGEYLIDCYDERTLYVHPQNEIGAYWCPPWDVDTCMETLDFVRDLLKIYILEYHQVNS